MAAVGILMYETLPGSLRPQTPPKNGATSLQSSDFGWNLQSKHHHHFIDGPVGLRMTYVGYFDVWNLAWKSQTPNPLKNRGHRPPKFWFWMKFSIKASSSLHRWPSWPPDDLFLVFSCMEPCPNLPKTGGHWPPKVLILDFGGQWPCFFRGFGVWDFQAMGIISKYLT